MSMLAKLVMVTVQSLPATAGRMIKKQDSRVRRQIEMSFEKRCCGDGGGSGRVSVLLAAVRVGRL